ncbi:serine/threonine-protein kinase [Haliangium sp.]|uniref:serine/threonine-protein kinase n=1 Tax=Haliangium sp. TaxID=2663208 RepID=UPI003D0BBFAD
MIGEAVGRYRIEEEIAKGGMGVVYRARHELLGKLAAVKLLRREFSENETLVERFFQEARATISIHHPGIIEVFDFGTLPSGRAFLVMELLDGETLAERCARRGRLSVSAALALGRSVASAVGAAHAAGVIHRDLKPANIFLVPDPDVPGGERVKVLDFGLAKLAEPTHSSVRTHSGALMGTPTYMAPEQCRGRGPVDHRADLYALGCILFELLCGRPPFNDGGPGEIIAAHLQAPVPSPRSLRAAVPDDVDALIVKLLAKDPESRVASMNDVRAALGARSFESRVASSLVSGAISSRRESDQQTPANQRRGRADLPTDRIGRPNARLPLWWLGVGIAVGAVVAAVLLRRQPPVATDPTPVVAVPAGSIRADAAVPVSAPAADAAVVVPVPEAAAVASTPPAEPAASPVRLRLRLDPADARVSVDGVRRRDNPLSLDPRRRPYRVRVSAPDHRPQIRRFQARADATWTIRLEPELPMPEVFGR